MTQKERFQHALNSFADKIKGDPNVIALIVSGSFAYGTVWEKSDLDLTMLVRDGSITKYSNYGIEEEKIPIHLIVEEVKTYKHDMSVYKAGEFCHGFYGKSKFVFTKDPALPQIFEETRIVGIEDTISSSYTRIQFLLGNMDKAEKWITVFDDPLYSQHFLQWCAQTASEILVLFHGEEPDRESILRASELEPERMEKLYVKPCSKLLTKEEVRETLEELTKVLLDFLPLWSGPILQYLSDGEVRTDSELMNYFGDNMCFVMEFLAKQGLVEKLTKPSRVFKHSSLLVDENAYFSVEGACGRSL